MNAPMQPNAPPRQVLCLVRSLQVLMGCDGLRTKCGDDDDDDDDDDIGCRGIPEGINFSSLYII
jgi:hypothetical protein